MSNPEQKCELETAAGKTIKITQKDQWQFAGMPLAVSGSVTVAAAVLGVISNVPMDSILHVMSIVAGVSLPLSGFMGMAMLASVRKEKAVTALYGEYNALNEYQAFQKMKGSKKGRTFINSFFVREANEVDVNSWRKYDKSIPVDQSTHIINQYITKDKSGYRIEQEIIPNDETIWDISADALVEVYEVAEKTNLNKGVSA